MCEFIYLKNVQDYEEICRFKRVLFLKKAIFYFKNKFNIITKKNINNINIWILPYMKDISLKKLEKIMRKEFMNKEVKLILSSNLKKKDIIDIFDKYNVQYISGNLAKRELLFKVMSYINKLQKKKQNEREITILTNEIIEENINLITRIAFESKSIKIVSKNINKYKNLEEKLYNENGIAIQFSNSYRKSLKNSDIIINLDFTEVEINEYEINSNAIIINTENRLRIKAKSFNGILINSYNIEFVRPSNELNQIVKLLKEFNNLDVYESIINSDKKHLIKENNIKILNTIGNNGIILEKEFKNISQKY